MALICNIPTHASKSLVSGHSRRACFDQHHEKNQ
jgi:hypothetical protein